jgi:aminopeptidase N
LGNYSAWFPNNPEYGNFSYKIQLYIEDGYKVSGMGEIRKTNGKWEIIQDHLINDIVIIASRELKSIIYSEEQEKIRIDYLLLKDDKVKELIEHAKFILQLYNNWFIQKNEKYTIVLVPPFPNRGSYYRKGFIALLQPEPGTESDIRTFKLLAHEFAHDWWSGANTNNWEDWLNESFAEYSCLMAIREKYGNEIFNDWIHYKTFSSKLAEPVIGYPDNRRTSQSTRYDKGPVALFHLENLLGKEKFIKVLNEVNKSELKTTDELLNKLEVLTSQKERASFEQKLKQ